MRGSPILRALFALICILVLGIPVWRLTREVEARPVPAPALSAEQAKKASVELQLSFTTIPASVRVLHLGEEIWSSSTTTQEMQQQLKLEYPKEGVDLEFVVEWPGESLSAMKVILTDPEGTPHERSLWGRGTASEVFTFQ